MLNFCSSHYLGLAVDDRLKKAACEAIDKWGIGTGYRTLAGTNSLNIELEKRIADFKQAEAAVVFPSGYLANCAAIQTIFSKEDVVISDELNHASIIDAIKLAGIKNKHIYKHNDIADLERILEETNKSRDEGKVLIVTDGVFSMDGDLAPLPEIIKLAKKYGAITMVDDAHGEGVMGDGQGTAHCLGVRGQIDIEVGTLSKAFSVIGGFITGKRALIDFYKQKARQFMFTSAMTAPDTAALLEAVKAIQESDELIKKLWANTRLLKTSLKKAGFDIGQSESPITPMMLGDEDLAVKFASELFTEGVFATSIRFPMVAKGQARIRLIPSAGHSTVDIEFGVEKIVKVGNKLKVI